MSTARRTALTLAGMGVALSLVACSPGGAATGDGDTNNGKTTLTWWDYFQDEKTVEAVEAAIATYESDHPDVSIDREFVAYDDIKQTLLQSAGAASLPDIVVVNSPDHQQFAELGIAADLTERLSEWGELDQYPEGVVASASFKDKVYGLPFTTNCLALFYNKTMLDEAGVQPPTTWEELRSTAESLTTDEHYGYAFSAVNNQQAVFQWLPTLWQSGGDITDLDSPEAVEALEFWGDFVEDGSVSKEALNWDQAMVADEFGQQRAAMMINGPWQLPFLEESAPDLDYGVALLPRGNQEASALGGENYMVVEGPQQDAAWDLLKWLQTPEQVEKMAAFSGSLPTRADTEPFSDDPNLAVFTEQLATAKPRAYGANYAEIADHIVAAIQSVLTGQKSASDALAEAAVLVDPLLK